MVARATMPGHDDDSKTLRPPAPGFVENVSAPAPRIPSAPPSPSGSHPRDSDPRDSDPRDSDRDSGPRSQKRRIPKREPGRRESTVPPPALKPGRFPRSHDPRSEGGYGIHAEVARSSIDALGSSMPEPLAEDDAQRIDRIVHDLARSGPEGDLPLRKRVVALGAAALPAIERQFPGALWVALGRPHRPLRSAAQLCALGSALVAIGDPALPFVERLLRARRPESRLAAALVAADLVDGTLVKPLGARLHDDVPAVRNAAMIAMRACALLPEARMLHMELVETLKDESKPADWRRKAAWTLGQIRDTQAIPHLIEALAAQAEVALVARQALMVLTGLDLGRFRFRWRAWYKRHKDAPRVLWLVDALDQDEAELRALVIDELVLLTGEAFDKRIAWITREESVALGAIFRAWHDAPQK